MADTLKSNIVLEKEGYKGTIEPNTSRTFVVKFSDSVNRDTRGRINSGRMNNEEYVRLANAVFGNGIYTEEHKNSK